MSGRRKIYNPSLLWLIERAVILQHLEELMQHAVKCTTASSQTRRQWADACERRQFILERDPPKFEKIGVAEVFTAEELKDPRLKMTPDEVVRQVLDMRHFKCAEDGIFEFVGEGDMPKAIADYFDGEGCAATAAPSEIAEKTDEVTPPASPLPVFKCSHDSDGDGNCHLCAKTGVCLEKRCPGCDGLGYIVKPGVAFDPPSQEPCPVCGP